MSEYFKIRALKSNWVDKDLFDEKFGVKKNGKDFEPTPLSQEIRDTIREVGEDLKRFNNSPEEEKNQIKGRIFEALGTVAKDISTQKNSFARLKNPEDVKKGLAFSQELKSKLANIETLCLARFGKDDGDGKRVMKDVEDAELLGDCFSEINKALRQLTFSKNFKYAERVEAKKTISSRFDSALKGLAETFSVFKTILGAFGWKAADAVKLLEKNEQELRNHVEKLRVLDPKDEYFAVSLNASQDAWNELKQTAGEYVGLGIAGAKKIAEDTEIDNCLAAYRALLSEDAELPEIFTDDTFQKLYDETKTLSEVYPTPENRAKLSNKAAIALGVLEILWETHNERPILGSTFLKKTGSYSDAAQELSSWIIAPENESDSEKAKTWKFAQETAKVIKAASDNYQDINERSQITAARDEDELAVKKKEKTDEYNAREVTILAQGRAIRSAITANQFVDSTRVEIWIEDCDDLMQFANKHKISSENSKELWDLRDAIARFSNDIGRG